MNRRKCSIEGCDAPHERHGFCAKHAQRFMRYGDPLFVTEKEIAVDKMRQSLARNHPANPNTYKKFYGKHIHRIVAEEKSTQDIMKKIHIEKEIKRGIWQINMEPQFLSPGE